MRVDFEQCGCALHFDIMKQKTNFFEWTYILILAVDGNESPRCLSEGIVCVERNEGLFLQLMQCWPWHLDSLVMMC